ncbi:MAG: AI-2E family transporter [Candidatus Shapirobacteria bacterium]|nr:AI-2E family transporter [Candidatus Shapirobacteria bacterium]
MKPTRVEISYKTIIFTVLFLIALSLLWLIRDIILLFFVCFLLMLSLNPTINRLEKFKIPRTVSIFIIYAIVIAFFSFALAGIIPILVNQTSDLVRDLPSSLQNVQILGLSAVDLSSQFKILETIPADIAKTIVSIFSNIFSGFIILVITFYLLHERRNVDKYSLKFLGAKGQLTVRSVFEQLEARLGHWVNAELLLMTIIGILSYIGYLFLGLPYALPLALIAGLLEIVPNIGPIITTFIAALVGLTVSPFIALMTILWGIVVHQSENNFITPKIMKETVGLNPIITILSIATGAKLAGIGGALLAVPIYLAVETVVKVLSTRK